ncbi:MAG: Ig-like domain-containing protein, partial [Clostridiales bacterium]
MKKYIYWLTALTVALLAVAMALFLDKTKEIPIDAAQNAQLTPTVVDMGGVDVNSAFSFSFGDKVKASWVRQYLKVEPALEMGFHQGSNNREVLVAPAQPLKADTVYRFTLLAEGKPFHWAFQTKPVLAVKTISPGDKITSVPLNSQITIDFNCSGMMGKKDYFSLEPATEGVFSSSGSQVVFTPQKPLQPDTVYTVKIGKGWPLEDSDLQLQEDYQYSFATASSGNVVDDWSFAEDDLLFAPGEKQFLPIKTYHNIFTGEDIQGEIYAYPDALSFSKALGDKYQSLPS